MVDPSYAMNSFQEEFLLGRLKLQRCSIHHELFVHYEEINKNSFRLTYIQFEGKNVIAFVTVVPCEPFEKIRCFQIGYAVPEKYRNRGLAKETIKMVFEEMKYGYKKAQIHSFYIEAIVDAQNEPSLKVAKHTISDNPVEIIDKLSGLKALQFLRKLE